MARPKSRHGSKFRWIYAVGADLSLKPSTKLILVLAALKKGTQAELDGEPVVTFKASYTEIAEWTGLHRVTVINEIKAAELAGWIERDTIGGEKGRNTNTYVLAMPTTPTVPPVRRGSHATTRGVVTPLPEGLSRHYQRGSQARYNTAGQELANSAEVLEEPEGSEKNKFCAPAPRSRSLDARGPRGRGLPKNNTTPTTTLDIDDGQYCQHCIWDADYGDDGLYLVTQPSKLKKMGQPEPEPTPTMFSPAPGCNTKPSAAQHLHHFDGPYHLLVCTHGSGKEGDPRPHPKGLANQLVQAGWHTNGLDAWPAEPGDPSADDREQQAEQAYKQAWQDERAWLDAERQWYGTWLEAERNWKRDVNGWLAAKQVWAAAQQAIADCIICDNTGNWLGVSGHTLPCSHNPDQNYAVDIKLFEAEETKRCQLCDERGAWLNPHGNPVEMEDVARGKTVHFKCRHDHDTNTATLIKIHDYQNFWCPHGTGHDDVDKELKIGDYSPLAGIDWSGCLPETGYDDNDDPDDNDEPLTTEGTPA